jgi:adenosylcobinamide-GDP ribazoletransferase
MGAVGIMSILILKIGFLSSFPTKLFPSSLIMMPVLSRWSIAIPSLLFPYARREKGKGSFYIEGANLKNSTIATGTTLILTFLFFHFKGLFLLLIIGISAVVLGKYLDSRLGGLTGDTLGFIIEIEEVITLFLIFLLMR